MVWIYVTQDRGSLASCSEYGNESLISIKGGKFLDCLSEYQGLCPMDVVGWLVGWLVN
jgi:hypothetical protein